MSFDLQVSFSGLGVALVKSADEGKNTVDLLMVNDDEHVPRLSFYIDDLLRIDQDFFGSDSYSSPHSTASSQIIELDLTNTDCGVFVEADPKAKPAPASVAGLEDLSGVPHIHDDLGIDDLIVPDGPLAAYAGNYIARMRLPFGGVLRSRRLFLKPDGAVMVFKFGKRPAVNTIAEQWVWTIGGVTSVDLNNLTGCKPLSLDPALRLLRREHPLVRLVVTNLPKKPKAQRFGIPDHFPMYSKVSKKEKEPAGLTLMNPDVVTPSGACPPVRGEV